MKAKPILLKPHEVRGILNGRKTQMRRTLAVPDGWQVESAEGRPCVLGEITSPHPKKGCFGVFIRRESAPGHFEHDIIPCPYGEPGDVLWVREGFSGPHCMDAQDDLPAAPPSEWPADCEIHFWADGNPAYGDWTRPKPSIHMPRWASRITLEVTGIRVERLQDISEEDAIAEGCYQADSFPRSGLWTADGKNFTSRGPVKCFRNLWEQVNGYRLTAKNVGSSWDANPWVWVVEFTPHLMNVDELLKREAA